jgi:hypothetical protein
MEPHARRRPLRGAHRLPSTAVGASLMEQVVYAEEMHRSGAEQ